MQRITFTRFKFLNLKNSWNFVGHCDAHERRIRITLTNVPRNVASEKEKPIRGQTTWSPRGIHVSILDVREFYSIVQKRKGKKNVLFFSLRLSRKKKHSYVVLSVETYAARPTRPCSSPCYQLCALRRNLRSWSAAFAYKFADTPADIHSSWLSGSSRSSAWDAATTPRPETTRCRTPRTPRACRTRICIVPENDNENAGCCEIAISITHAGETLRETQRVCI